MYGLLLDSIQKFLTERYGERCWAAVRKKAGLTNYWFVTHEVYSDSVMSRLVQAAAEELDQQPTVIMRQFGEYFVQCIGQYGYARLLRVLGRDMRDFLNGLDDLHEYLRFSYPKMKPPSFFVESETPQGMLLHYTTCRRGFLDYVIGQLVRVGQIYGKELEVVQRSLDDSGEQLHYVLELCFDNSELLLHNIPTSPKLPYALDSEQFLGVFPFCFVFDRDLVIQWVGPKLELVLPRLAGRRLYHVFTLKKPQFCSFAWSQISARSNCVFEVVSQEPVTRGDLLDSSDPDMDSLPLLRLKGEMLQFRKQQSIVFLCSPVLDSPEDLYQSGIFINDLSKHDSSRDYVLAGSRQNPELKLALHQEKIRSAQLEDSSRKTDQLLYQMIPKPIADQLRNGETPLNTCREFDNVSVLFSDVVSFTPMCSRLRPMEVVCVLNAMCVSFDELCDKHGVYKVEMIGDGYMVICGAPEAQPRHAEFITDFACSIIDATSKINDPSTSQPLQIRVGIHSGPIVGGVVGTSILRYDVFGDTVNVAARMEATGKPMCIHVSEATADLLRESHFNLEQRGTVQVKGKGLMTTYWVHGRRAGASQLTPDRLTRPPVSPVSKTRPLLPSFKRISPEPHQWPQADQLAQRIEFLQPDQLAQRRSTTESPQPDQLAQRRPTIECPQPDQLAQRRPTIECPRPDLLAQRRPTIECPVFRRTSTQLSSVLQLSELNLLKVRGSLSVPNPVFTESLDPERIDEFSKYVPGSIDELKRFAALAEESARQARAVANVAAEMVRVKENISVCNSAESIERSTCIII